MLEQPKQPSLWKRIKPYLDGTKGAENWNRASKTSKVIRTIIGLILLYYTFQFLAWVEGDTIYQVKTPTGSIEEITIHNGCARLLDKAANGNDLSEGEVKKLLENVPRNDAEVVYQVLRRKWYEDRGWEDPALTLYVLDDTNKFIQRYYNNE